MGNIPAGIRTRADSTLRVTSPRSNQASDK